MRALLYVVFCWSMSAQTLLDWNQIKNKPSSFGGGVGVSDYNFAAQSIGSVSVGSNTKTLRPCPRGVSGTDSSHYLYISGGTGAAEGVLISGGTCTSGAVTGTITFTAANSHTGASISSDSGGIREAMLANPNGVQVLLSPATTIQTAKGIRLDVAKSSVCGQGWSSVVKARDAAALNEVISITAADITLCSFKIDGNRDNVGSNITFGSGVAITTDGTRARIEKCEVMDNAKFGIADTGSYFVAEGNYVHDNGDSLTLAGSGSGFWVGNSPRPSDIRILNNRIEHNHNSAIINVAAVSCTGAAVVRITTVIPHGMTTGEPAGISGVAGCAAANVSLNAVTVVSATVFTLDGTTGNGTTYTSGGTVKRAGYSGAIGVDGTNVTIRGNYIRNNHNQSGGQIASIGTAGVTRNWTISDNILEMTEDWGGDQTSGLELAFNGFAVTGNVILGYLERGCGVCVEADSNASAGEGAITGNYIYNSRSGVQLFRAGSGTGNSRAVTVSGNRITASTYGILADASANQDVVVGNELLDNTTPISDPNRLLMAWANTPITTAAGSAMQTGFSLSTAWTASSVSTIASASTISPLSGQQVFATGGSAAISTIDVPAGGLPGYFIRIIPSAGSTWTMDLAGNIGKAVSSVAGKVLDMVWDGTKWWPSY